MDVRLAYGEDDLYIEVDLHRTTIAEPVFRSAAADVRATLRAALRDPVAGPPLRERVGRGQTVAISACDGTRPQARTAATARPNCGGCSETRPWTRCGS